MVRLQHISDVEGICIERKTRLGSGGAVLHCPVYEITLNGETLRMEKEVYSNVGVPQIGESRTQKSSSCECGDMRCDRCLCLFTAEVIYQRKNHYNCSHEHSHNIDPQALFLSSQHCDKTCCADNKKDLSEYHGDKPAKLCRT